MTARIPRKTVSYSALAAGYDLVMTHVNYSAWAEYIVALIEDYRSKETDVLSLLELGCGTGSIGLAICGLRSTRYTGLDLSQEMIAVAQRKSEALGVDCDWIVGDFLDHVPKQKVDVVILLYDGLNYATEPDQLGRLFDAVSRSLRPGGLFLVDQSTPANSENNGGLFEDSGGDERFSYRRSSSYDAESRLHRTVFSIDQLGTTYEEEHVQRAYTEADIRPYFRGAGMEVVASFTGFTRKPVSGATERIQWVARLAGSDSV